MKFIEITQATASLAEYARDLEDGTIVVTLNGKPIAALVPCDERDVESALPAKNPESSAILERSRAQDDVDGDISPEEIRRAFGMDN